MMELFSKCYDCLRRRRKDRASQDGEDEEEDGTSWNLFFPLQALQIATNFFSELNQLGHGGFGPVYKGLLPNGQEIAVKRLALNSRQGLREFTNEVKLLLKIQHKNLVTLFGCCVDGPEKMLVYEYLHNKSLDCFLFDKSKSGSLSWSIRYEIIIGIARGLLYLHEEAPVRIIHRDIKASNILLDEQLKPKISDFGLARLFPGDGTHLNTFKIAGTHGYMAPEYAMHGYLSAKADVFSFGVLLLEIVSGRKNYDEKLDSGKTDLLSYTWKLWKEDKTPELLDPTLTMLNKNEASICIQLGLLCCQTSVQERPDMNTIHLTLLSDLSLLPKPGKPALYGRVGGWTTTSSAFTGTDTATSSTSAPTNASNSTVEYSQNTISFSSVREGR